MVPSTARVTREKDWTVSRKAETKSVETMRKEIKVANGSRSFCNKIVTRRAQRERDKKDDCDQKLFQVRTMPYHITHSHRR